MMWRIWSILILLLLISYGLSVPADAAITNTEVSAGMRIDGYTGPPSYLNFTDVSMTDVDATNASVSIAGNVTSATAFSTWQLTSLDSDSANLYLNFGFNGSGVCDPTWDPDCDREIPSYLGQSVSGSNYAKIYYTANTDSDLLFAWNLDAQGTHRIDYAEGPSYVDTDSLFPIEAYIYEIHPVSGIRRLDYLYDFAETIGRSGQRSWTLEAGNIYYIDIYSAPNTSGGGLDRRSTSTFGNISIDFDHAVVPEPISSILFVTGGSLLAARRRFIRRKA